ncbi:MAG: 4-oxalocrotonate tautomerase family protein [Paenibacillus sp.]|uniref:tautomerase family protein n=1 Tax=Paenibacillus sp. TaxID=58172 RepID=UPI003B7EB892
MPEITIRLYEGRTDEQKQEIVEVFTRELSRIIDREPDYISIKFNEIPWDENVPDNLRAMQSQKQGGEKT